jgi:hypothetical protein
VLTLVVAAFKHINYEIIVDGNRNVSEREHRETQGNSMWGKEMGRRLHCHVETEVERS